MKFGFCLPVHCYLVLAPVRIYEGGKERGDFLCSSRQVNPLAVVDQWDLVGNVFRWEKNALML